MTAGTISCGSAPLFRRSCARPESFLSSTRKYLAILDSAIVFLFSSQLSNRVISSGCMLREEVLAGGTCSGTSSAAKAPIYLARIRAKGVDGIRARKKHESTTRMEHREKEGNPCTECARFAVLLKEENVSRSILASASKHRFLCEPNPTPQNLWQPWSIPATDPNEKKLSN